MANTLNTDEGTTGQILKHNGANTAPTFTSNFGGLKLIQTYTANNSPSINMVSVLNNTLYSTYVIMASNITCVNSGAVTLRAKFSSNNGSTWDATTYTWTVETSNSDSTIAYNVFGNSPDSFAQVSIGNLSQTEPAQLELNLVSTGVNTRPVVFAEGSGFNDVTGFRVFGYAYGQPTNTYIANAFQLYASVGNINTGTFELYGYSL